MDKLRHKSKKEKPMKHVEKDQSNLFITDVRAIKENLKIKEILRTVKMNSSMRIKAPKGSKVMQNKDFNDNEDIFGGEQNSQEQNTPDPPSATNPDVIVNNNNVEINENNTEDFENKTIDIKNENKEQNGDLIIEREENNINTNIHESVSVPEGLSDFVLISDEVRQNNPGLTDVKIDLPSPTETSHVKARDRKLSLDQTMLSRRGGLSQSELDLNSIGKSPLERKSSFFRKKMDSFLKNTTEIFKRQSLSRSQSVQRKGSMSVSLQSLNENTTCNGDYGVPLHDHKEELQGSLTSLQSSLTPAQTGSSLSISQSERTLPDPQSEGDSLAGSRPVLTGSQPLGDLTSHSIHSLSETHIQEASLNRAISMSSGLDSAHGQNRRKFRANRVTWLASEGLTNHLRRLIQDEKCREMNVCHSYQDFSTIPENNLSGLKTDSKGRRLSYQRAVSGEDPRYHEAAIRRKQLIPENTESNLELSDILAEYSRSGIPNLQGFSIASIEEEALRLLSWAERPENLESIFNLEEMPPREEARQAVIRELINTEADYIRHLLSIVQVFISTAHALQDNGKMLDVDTEKLFCNIPDVLNASLNFWEITMYPMIADAIERRAPFNTEIMAEGFMHLRELFYPYEKYVNEQTKALNYLRSLSNNVDFMCYLTWCYSQKACNRLQLADIMVKPMQRLTKYSLILRRLISHTDSDTERNTLQDMETCAKNYVQDLNRSMRQREELEKLDQLADSIEPFDMDIKDEDLEKMFRKYSPLNLRAPMAHCNPNHSRTLIYEGDLRYKDYAKETEVHAFLLTDILLICKKLSKGGPYSYKLIRPKFFIDKLIINPRTTSKYSKEISSLAFVALDEIGTSHFAFILSESTKDPNASGTLKMWELKLREAKYTYDLLVWFSKHPVREFSDFDFDTSSDGASKGMRQNSDEINIEREARERVATMLHRSMGASTDYEGSQASLYTDSFDDQGDPSTSGGRQQIFHNLRHPMKRNSTGGSSRASRLSSFHQSTSAASHDEPQPGPSRYYYRAGTSVEHVIPPLNPDDAVTSITVNVVSESESETVLVHAVPPPPLPPPPPMLVLQHSSPNKTPLPSRSSSSSRNTLRVQPPNVVMALVHSLPDLSVDATPPRPQQSPSPQSASDKLYQSHQELLQRNRLSAQQQHQQRYLSPDQRGTSYPPPSPTRASLKRGLAFSYSFKNPPLSKMGHVYSQSEQAAEGSPSTNQVKGEKDPTPGTSAEKPDKKSKNISSRNKGGSTSPASRKDDKGD